MKKQLLIIPAIALLASCGGGQQTQQNNAGSDSVQAATTIPTFTYVEPNEDIAGKIWELIAEDDTDFNGEETLDTDTASKTYKCQEYNLWSRYDDINIFSSIELKCYQMEDSSWMAVVRKKMDESVEGSQRIDKTIYAVHYHQGKISRLDSTAIFPDVLFQIADIYRSDKAVFLFNNTCFEVRSTNFWPVKFYWNGKKFVSIPQSPLIQNADHTNSGQYLSYRDPYHKTYFIDINSKDPDSDLHIASDGTFKDSKGNPIVKFDLADGKITGYQILSPTLALAKDWRSDSLSGLPMAIGQPIKNVLTQISDTLLTKTTKDGKLVVKYRVKHDEISLFDAYREFTANDENSPIESVHVYAVPLVLDLNTELEKQALDPETKKIFTAFKIDERVQNLGRFKRLSGMGHGINLDYESGDYHFQTYDADNGGQYVLLIKKTNYKLDPATAKWWHYNNGKFQPAQIEMPCRPFNDENYELEIGDDGIAYSNYSEKDFRSYPWNGDGFDNEYDEEETTQSTIATDAWLMINNYDYQEVKSRIPHVATEYPTVAIECFDGDEYSRSCRTYACYQYSNKQRYLVLYYEEMTDNTGLDLYTMTSDALMDYDGNPFETDIIQKSTDERSMHLFYCGKYIFESFDADGFVLQPGSIRFTWNGEKFVKQ